MASQALPYLPTVSHKERDFWEKKLIQREMCILIFSANFGWNTSHSKNNST